MAFSIYASLFAIAVIHVVVLIATEASEVARCRMNEKEVSSFASKNENFVWNFASSDPTGWFHMAKTSDCRVDVQVYLKKGRILRTVVRIENEVIFYSHEGNDVKFSDNVRGVVYHHNKNSDTKMSELDHHDNWQFTNEEVGVEVKLERTNWARVSWRSKKNCEQSRGFCGRCDSGDVSDFPNPEKSMAFYKVNPSFVLWKANANRSSDFSKQKHCFNYGKDKPTPQGVVPQPENEEADVDRSNDISTQKDCEGEKCPKEETSSSSTSFASPLMLLLGGAVQLVR